MLCALLLAVLLLKLHLRAQLRPLVLELAVPRLVGEDEDFLVEGALDGYLASRKRPLLREVCE